MNNMQGNHSYDDIINLPHPVSKKHPRMSDIARAAQFSPFAALTGYDSAVGETARLTDEKIELDEDMINDINAKLWLIKDNIAERPEITIKYFVQDERKSGGAYVVAKGNVKQIDDYERVVILTDNTKISIDNIYTIEGELFFS